MKATIFNLVFLLFLASCHKEAKNSKINSNIITDYKRLIRVEDSLEKTNRRLNKLNDSLSYQNSILIEKNDSLLSFSMKIKKKTPWNGRFISKRDT